MSQKPVSEGRDAQADSRRDAWRVLFSLMFPAVLMPMVSTMSRVALPVIRDDFGLQADVTAWVVAGFGLPFMILMPVYGGLSDGLDKRRLILVGVVVLAIGTTMTVFAVDLFWLMAGRVVQGLGVAGMMPVGMALISSIFKPHERGKARGTWSAVGPMTGFFGPLAAGFLVAAWGWRAAFAPPLLFSLFAIVAVMKGVPSRDRKGEWQFLKSFDWRGVFLLAGVLTALVFFLSSRSITGVPAMQDWRLLAAAVVLIGVLVWWERGRKKPFVALDIFENRMFLKTSFCASMRMMVLGGLTFLVPLYLVDIHGLEPEYLGAMLMVNSGAMALIVRFGGGMSDRWQSRRPVVIGLGTQALVMVLFSFLPEDASIPALVGALALHGLGAGLMLAALHRAVMGSIEQARMGSAAGLYSMFRFLGAVAGTALSGVILQAHLDASLPMIEAYQNVFLVFAAFPLAGVLVGLWLKEPVG